MKEKRISLRFQEENEQDMRAWKMLEKVAKERNILKNAATIDLILAKEEQVDSADELAKHIALLVVDKLQEDAIYVPMGSGVNGNSVSVKEKTAKNTDTNYPADEPEVLGEEALDFLEMFGWHDTEKPVKRELALIKQDTKQLPALLGGESYFKISGRNLNRLMDMAQGSGILKNLNTTYEKELTLMEKKIHRLKEQEKTLKAKLKQYELFIDVKGLVDAFKEFIRPKTIQEQLNEKKAIVESQKKIKVEKANLKKEYDRVV